ncbi:MAG: zinc ribbon domain-containing protein [Clostridia bacterium]|nr:zinc ribbon domain-containing protein [Clostridia bacterium]
MYCKHCGKEISNTANVCRYCGKPTTNKNRQTPPRQMQKAASSLNPVTLIKRKSSLSQDTESKNLPEEKTFLQKYLLPAIIVAIVAIIVGCTVGIKTYVTNKQTEEINSLTAILKKNTEKPIIEIYLEDYDNDNINEAFAIVGVSTEKGDHYFDADVWFVSEKKIQMIAGSIKGTSNGIIKSGKKKYISFENAAYGDDTTYSFIYGVKDGVPFESETSGKYHKVHRDGAQTIGQENIDGAYISIDISPKEHLVKDDYSSITLQYEKVVKNNADPNEALSLGKHIDEQVVNLYNNKENGKMSIYYALYDINDDKTRECIIGVGPNEFDVTPVDLFTHNEKNPVPLLESNPVNEKTSLKLLTNGVVLLTTQPDEANYIYLYSKLPANSSKLKTTDQLFEENGEYFMLSKFETKDVIDKAQFNEILIKYNKNTFGKKTKATAESDTTIETELDLEWIKIIPGQTQTQKTYETQYVNFGSYPQTKETDAEIINQLNSLASDWTSYRYYSAINTPGQDPQPGDFMKYTDVVYNNTKYRGVTFSKYRPNYTTALPIAEKSFQDDNGYSINQTYWFRYEPIMWKVLDSDQCLLISENIIDAQPFSSTIYYFNNQYWSDLGFSLPTNNYATSYIRGWLNDSFYKTAFSGEEKRLIESTTCKNVNPQDASQLYNDTTDDVFIPSFNEMIETDFGFDANPSKMNKPRRAEGTDYAKCQGLQVVQKCNYPGNSWSWVRSPRSDSRDVYCINANGSAMSVANVDSSAGGVRPMVKLSELPEIIDNNR